MSVPPVPEAAEAGTAEATPSVEASEATTTSTAVTRVRAPRPHRARTRRADERVMRGNGLSFLICFLFGYALDAPVRRVAAMDTFVAYQPLLEDAILPQVDDLYRAMKELAEY